ncbi:MAG: conserved rane protein of unknown function [Blastococcus sp.]|jgi:hypothetical protein|nr:conserved rane protein of unknown function [Blastococcus sp.]
MSERNGQSPAGTGTAEIPVVRDVGGPTAPVTPETGPVPPAVGPVAGGPAVGSSAVGSVAGGPAVGSSAAVAEGLPGPNPEHAHPTAPVTVRPAPRMPRRGPLTVMGPWAPVAGGLLGLLLGLIAVLVLAGSAQSFEDRLGLVFAVVGLGTLGVSGTLLADEVRMVRQGAREATVRPAWVEVTAGLLNGLTPARLLLLVSAFVLFLSAYVSRG